MNYNFMAKITECPICKNHVALLPATTTATFCLASLELHLPG